MEETFLYRFTLKENLNMGRQYDIDAAEEALQEYKKEALEDI
jgi:ABC-type multidrug transport system fused ATPase/permease subunit